MMRHAMRVGSNLAFHCAAREFEDALPRQLGVRLEDGEAPFDVLVIDRAATVPAGN